MVRFLHPVRCRLPEAKIQLVKIYFVVSMVRFAGLVVTVRLKIQQRWNFSTPDCGWPRGNSPMTSHNGVFPLAAPCSTLLFRISWIQYRCFLLLVLSNWRLVIKGNMHMISPDRTRFCCQIRAYLVTIHLLYGTRCLSY